MASPDLIWQLVKDNNSFLVKRSAHGKQFTREKYNLRNVNSFKNSGLANYTGVDLSVGAGKSVGFNLKKSGKAAQNKPALANTTGTLNKSYRKGSAAVKAAVSAYRADLTGDALARFNQLKKINSRPASLPQKKQRRRNARK